MNKMELEKATSEIKGVASMLLMMSEVPKGDYKWEEWLFYDLFLKLEDCVERLETLYEPKEEEKE